MFQHKLTPILSEALLCGVAILPLLPAAEPIVATGIVARAQTEDAHPFTHLAQIPANSDLGTIRFEGIKRVNVPARIEHVADANYCAELAFSEPGGSMFCPYLRTASVTSAYEVTYSFTGQPMASDELASRHFTFEVYFRPDELAPEVRQAASAKNRNRADTAGYFAVHTYRGPARRVVVDTARSSYCPGAYQDGVWIRSDESCRDEIRYMAMTMPSDSVTVSVDAVPMPAQRAAVTAANTKPLEDSSSSR
jgi:hypothetical protein